MAPDEFDRACAFGEFAQYEIECLVGFGLTTEALERNGEVEREVVLAGGVLAAREMAGDLGVVRDSGLGVLFAEARVFVGAVAFDHPEPSLEGEFCVLSYCQGVVREMA